MVWSIVAHCISVWCDVHVHVKLTVAVKDVHTFICDFASSGPSAVAMDISFPGVEHVYGIPEHADTFLLKTTKSVTPAAAAVYLSV